MGWAKYTEDNTEIMADRIAMFRYTSSEFTASYNKHPSYGIINQNAPVTDLETDDIIYRDEKLFCKDCGRPFIFSAKAQKTYNARGWDPPVRCKPCRDTKQIRYLMYCG